MGLPADNQTACQNSASCLYGSISSFHLGMAFLVVFSFLFPLLDDVKFFVAASSIVQRMSNV